MIEIVKADLSNPAYFHYSTYQSLLRYRSFCYLLIFKYTFHCFV